MSKRAVIYIRVSTESQTEGASLTEQERDCRNHADKKGYEVLEVFRDVGSATSVKKRPEFKRMLGNAQVGRFDVVLAWREDRLYRGYMDTGFMDLMRLIQDEKIDIELAKENFDKTMAIIKAAMAEEENRARVDRITMGVKARLRAGKPWGIEKKYGYSLDENGEATINQIEAKWINQIYKWYLEDVGVREISRKLLTEGAPQKISTKTASKWQMSTLYRILNDETYSSGIHKVKRGGEIFDISVPQIVDPDIFNQSQKKLEKNKSHPVRNVKYNYLLSGLVTSPCEVKWNAYSRSREQPYGYKPGTYPAVQGNYRCGRTTQVSKNDHHHPDCPRYKGVIRFEKYVWNKISEVIRNPEKLLEIAQLKFDELQTQHKDSSKRKREIETKLESIQNERDAYIEQYGKSVSQGGRFTENDLERALERLSNEEAIIKGELSEILFLSNSQFSNLDNLVNSHMEDIALAADWLDKKPESEEEKELQFKERKAIIELLVDKVYLEKGKDPRIDFVIDLSELLHIQSQVY
jgi:DNA invertase Pin-like site-specific DNA recombinase